MSQFIFFVKNVKNTINWNNIEICAAFEISYISRINPCHYRFKELH